MKDSRAGDLAGLVSLTVYSSPQRVHDREGFTTENDIKPYVIMKMLFGCVIGEVPEGGEVARAGLCHDRGQFWPHIPRVQRPTMMQVWPCPG